MSVAQTGPNSYHSLIQSPSIRRHVCCEKLVQKLTIQSCSTSSIDKAKVIGVGEIHGRDFDLLCYFLAALYRPGDLVLIEDNLAIWDVLKDTLVPTESWDIQTYLLQIKDLNKQVDDLKALITFQKNLLSQAKSEGAIKIIKDNLQDLEKELAIAQFKIKMQETIQNTDKLMEAVFDHERLEETFYSQKHYLRACQVLEKINRLHETISKKIQELHPLRTYSLSKIVEIALKFFKRVIVVSGVNHLKNNPQNQIFFQSLKGIPYTMLTLPSATQ